MNLIESRNIKVKTWLNRYMYDKREVRRLEQEYDELVESQEGVKGVAYDGIRIMSGGDNTADLANMIISRDANLTRLITARSKLEQTRNEISETISLIPDTDGCKAEIIRTVLSQRYILLDGLDQQKWEMICINADISWSRVHKYHSAGLKALAILLGY